MEIKFNEVDVAKLNLTRDDVLVITVKTKRDESSGFENFAHYLQETFDQNKVVVLGLGENDEVKFTVVKEPPVQSYCSDCNCGKKEASENDLSKV